MAPSLDRSERRGEAGEDGEAGEADGCNEGQALSIYLCLRPVR